MEYTSTPPLSMIPAIRVLNAPILEITKKVDTATREKGMVIGNINANKIIFFNLKLNLFNE